MKLITKYHAAANLGITIVMLWNWIRSQPIIESMHQGGKKNRVTILYQKPIFKERLVELFIEARKIRHKITRH